MEICPRLSNFVVFDMFDRRRSLHCIKRVVMVAIACPHRVMVTDFVTCQDPSVTCSQL